MHEILRDFGVEIDHSIQARRPDLVLNNKKRICHLVDFAVPAHFKVKMKESEKILKSCLKDEKSVEHEVDSNTNNNWCATAW